MEDEPRIILDLTETEFELILLFMKVGLVIHDGLELDLGLPEEADEEAYIEQAEDLYERLTDIAKFEFIVRRLEDDPEI